MKQLNHLMNLLSQVSLNRVSTGKQILFCCSLFVFSVASAQQRLYEVPLSSSTATGVPSISEADMEQCVEIYNEANWLKQELDNAQVDLSQPAAVDAYNSKASLYSQMSDYFNTNCAGKQSKTAARVTQKLNQQNN